MGQISLQIPQTGQPNSTEDPKIASNFTTLQNVINGNIDHGNLATGAVLELLTTGTTRKAAFGNFVFTGNGTGEVAGVAIPHGLGITPQVALVLPAAWGFNGFCRVVGLDSTHITFNAESAWISGGWVSGGTVTGWTYTNAVGYSAYWLAIG